MYRSLFPGLAVFLFLLEASAAAADPLVGISNVFLIIMENHDWSQIQGSPNCPYINTVLLPRASYCNQYYNPPGLHPSEPNYIWLEAGTNFGILTDQPTNRIDSPNHLVTYLQRQGLSWRTYAEDIEPGYCPVTNRLNYRVRHTPQILFNDVSANEAYCADHVVPYPQLWSDLTSNTVARYNFLVPNKTNDMHDPACSTCSGRVAGDYWLSHEVPRIINSAAYTNGGLLMITWDEGANSTSDGPIGLIVLSPFARGGGYNNSIRYTHSSLLHTLQDIFQVYPYLGDAANANDLRDLFGPSRPPFLYAGRRLINGTFVFSASNLVAHLPAYLEASTDSSAWTPLRTNLVTSNVWTFGDSEAPRFDRRFYRVWQAP